MPRPKTRLIEAKTIASELCVFGTKEIWWHVVVLTASPLQNWRRPPARPRTMWMKTTQQDLESLNLSLNEAIEVAQNRPLWRLMSTFWHYTLIVVHARNEWMMNVDVNYRMIILFYCLLLCRVRCLYMTKYSNLMLLRRACIIWWRNRLWKVTIFSHF